MGGGARCCFGLLTLVAQVSLGISLFAITIICIINYIIISITIFVIHIHALKEAEWSSLNQISIVKDNC